MALYSWVENGRIIIPRELLPTAPFSVPPTINPFSYLPPELIVHILAETPASSIPALLETNHFFHIHIKISKLQLVRARLQQYPAQFLNEYASLNNVNFVTLHVNPKAWHILADLERKAECCLALQTLLFPKTPLSLSAERRYFRTFLRNWEARKSMFFTRQEWHEALLDRLHIYENASRSEICDIVHLQTLYRSLLTAQITWSPSLLPPLNPLDVDTRVHWSWKSPIFRNLIDHIIGCGPEVLLTLLRSSELATAAFLSQALVALECAGDGAKFSCFDDVMAKLLTRLDGGTGPASSWREEESYFDVSVVGNWFDEGDVRLTPMINRLYFRAALWSIFHERG